MINCITQVCLHNTIDTLNAQTRLILVLQSIEKGILKAISLAVEEEADILKRKRGKWSKEVFVQCSMFEHTKLLRELSRNKLSDL